MLVHDGSRTLSLKKKEVENEYLNENYCKVCIFAFDCPMYLSLENFHYSHFK